MDNVYINKVGVPQSLTGSQEWQVDKLDFDTSCDCQITACDGGTIKVCAKMEIEDLVIDSLCIDGELGCDSLVVETGAANGIQFTSDPCATPATARRLVLYEDVVTTLQSLDRNLVINSGSNDLTCAGDDITNTATVDINVTPGRDLKVTSGRDILLTCGTGGLGSFVGTASKYFNTVFSTSVMGSYLGTPTLPFSEVFTELIGDSLSGHETKNIFSRRINLATTVGGAKMFPSPGGAEGILPLNSNSIPPTFAGDLEGDMLIGYRQTFSSGGLTLYLCVDARVNPAQPVELRWYQLQLTVLTTAVYFQPY